MLLNETKPNHKLKQRKTKEINQLLTNVFEDKISIFRYQDINIFIALWR